MQQIFLIGYMGSGKTTVGKLLAACLDFSFIDLDHYIENRYNRRISDIFAEFGETGFRKIEHRLLQEVAEIEIVVVSTGGGAPCFFDNMQLMNSKGMSVYLRTSPAVLAERLQKAQSNRPLLCGKSSEELLAFIKKMLVERESFYCQASLMVENNDSNPQEVCEEILRKIKY
ncbi:MAG: shikimate kinase [Prevotellaceae bacterium]|jgi:shikimate kinase|nr:shikimate kinase [Prevotellaceae bacterium]